MKVKPKSPNCWSCHKPIEWGRTAAGKPIPLDPEPVADGNLAIAREGVDGDLPLVRVVKADEEIWTSEWRGISHFVTCPTANQHRKGRS